MFDIPTDGNVVRAIVNQDTIEKGAPVELIRGEKTAS